MPPLRTMPAVRPVRTERTHEENQERAYIAASRRSDRSLEARVESARRASEIHKKRTGRSLRVREEDVMNEEMYEEEDDDLPMQFRRINALHPGLAYSAFNERVNSYLAGQIGVRNYLHQAIYQANQSQYNNAFLNPMLQNPAFQSGTMSPQATNGAFPGQPQTTWPMANPQGVAQNQHGQSASFATPQESATQSTNATASMPSSASEGFDARRMSIPARRRSPAVPSPASHTQSATSSQPPTPHAAGQHPSSPDRQRISTSPYSGQAPNSMTSSFNQHADPMSYPLTTKLPIETQQLIDGSPAFMNAIHPSQLTDGIPMPSMGIYSYNPNGKSKQSSGGAPTGLHQTLSPYNMHYAPAVSPSYSEPQSALSAPANLDFGFHNDFYGDMGDFNDPTYAFNSGFSSVHPGANSGPVTPSTNAEPNWHDTDFFNYAAASD